MEEAAPEGDKIQGDRQNGTTSAVSDEYDEEMERSTLISEPKPMAKTMDEVENMLKGLALSSEKLRDELGMDMNGIVKANGFVMEANGGEWGGREGF